MNAREKYVNDLLYKMFVDSLVDVFRQSNITPTEMIEAVVLAVEIKNEQML